MPTSHQRANRVWIVLPAYNEHTYLTRVLRKIKRYTPRIIVVDDGSSDATTQLAATEVKHVLTHAVNLGKGAAMKTGCEYAFNELQADAVILLDADDQHDPALIPSFTQLLVQGTPVVCGVRDFSQMPVLRTAGNTVASLLVWLFFGRYIPDIPSGYQAFNRDAYQFLAWQSTGYSVEMEIAVRMAKHKIKHASIKIPTIYHDLSRGMTMLDVLGMLGQVISWRITL